MFVYFLIYLYNHPLPKLFLEYFRFFLSLLRASSRLSGNEGRNQRLSVRANSGDWLQTVRVIALDSATAFTSPPPRLFADEIAFPAVTPLYFRHPQTSYCGDGFQYPRRRRKSPEALLRHARLFLRRFRFSPAHLNRQKITGKSAGYPICEVYDHMRISLQGFAVLPMTSLSPLLFVIWCHCIFLLFSWILRNILARPDVWINRHEK